ncbi:hypothetical protein B5F34_14260 [Mediterranea sp. An20]|nr:hypothetical protein B5F34_14260 [Mediterranea sp. An20]
MLIISRIILYIYQVLPGPTEGLTGTYTSMRIRQKAQRLQEEEKGKKKRKCRKTRGQHNAVAEVRSGQRVAR